MTRSTLSVGLVAALFLIMPAFATTLVVSDCGTCAYQSWTDANANENGNPYWDGLSADGSQMNIGNFLGKTGGFAANGASPDANYDYYGNSIADGGAAATNIYFTTDAGFSANLIIEVAGLASSNIFGWYVRNADGTLGAKTQIFSGANGAGASLVFTPTANFGFYIETGDGFSYYTESRFNSNGTPVYGGGTDIDEALHQHFAMFSQNAVTTWFGVEDRTLLSEKTGANYGDYNDMVIRMLEEPFSDPVPEPGTYAMMGIGMVTLGILRRRKSA